MDRSLKKKIKFDQGICDIYAETYHFGCKKVKKKSS